MSAEPRRSISWAEKCSLSRSRRATRSGPSQLVPGQRGFLEALFAVNVSAPFVAFAEGVAGMLALETRPSSAVGVAISVTTIPAAAYLGVAAGVGDASKALGALAVLGVDVVMLLVGGSLTHISPRALA